jgi:hypothetical protein
MPNIKELTLAFLAASSGVLVFWFWRESIPLILEGQFRQYINFIGPVGGLIASASLFLLSTVLIKDKRVIYLLLLLGTSVPFLFVEATGTVLTVLGLSLFLVSFAIHRIRQESELSPGFSLTKFAKGGLHIYFTCAALIIAMFYLGNINEEQAVATLLPRAAFEILVPILENQTGITIPNKEEATEVIYRATVEQFKRLLGPYQDFLPLASAVIFFFAFKAFTIPLYYLALIFSYLLIRLALWGKIIKREIVQVEAEKLTL